MIGDFNENVKGELIKEWRESMQLRDVMIDIIGEVEMPATYNLGQDSVDTIMRTPNIMIKQAAYLPFGVGVGDRRPLVVEIDEISVFGTGKHLVLSYMLEN